MKFKGDIIITDPCYIVRAEHHGTEPLFEDDWSACDYGQNMEGLGIKTYFTENTLYGDWSCTTYNSDTKKKLGRFCADAGLVSVFLLDEVRAYNPDIDEWIDDHDWCVTTIKDFDGSIFTKITNGEDLSVIGEGNINFHTSQTGF